MDHWLAHTLAAWLAPAEETAEAAAAGHVLKTDEIDTVQLRSECSVKDHGAVDDDKTLDTVAINKAVQQCSRVTSVCSTGRKET